MLLYSHVDMSTVGKTRYGIANDKVVHATASLLTPTAQEELLPLVSRSSIRGGF